MNRELKWEIDENTMDNWQQAGISTPDLFKAMYEELDARFRNELASDTSFEQEYPWKMTFSIDPIGYASDPVYTLKVENICLASEILDITITAKF